MTVSRVSAHQFQIDEMFERRAERRAAHAELIGQGYEFCTGVALQLRNDGNTPSMVDEIDQRLQVGISGRCRHLTNSISSIKIEPPYNKNVSGADQ